MNFDLKLGLQLGGIFGVFEAFSTPVILMNNFNTLLNIDIDASKQKLPMKQRCELISKYFEKLEKKESVILSSYWNFFGEACVKINSNPEFVKWINQSTGDVMPTIFTFQILKIACHIIKN